MQLSDIIQSIWKQKQVDHMATKFISYQTYYKQYASYSCQLSETGQTIWQLNSSVIRHFTNNMAAAVVSYQKQVDHMATKLISYQTYYKQYGSYSCQLSETGQTIWQLNSSVIRHITNNMAATVVSYQKQGRPYGN